MQGIRSEGSLSGSPLLRFPPGLKPSFQPLFLGPLRRRRIEAGTCWIHARLLSISTQDWVRRGAWTDRIFLWEGS